jgi:hypothetical protein
MEAWSSIRDKTCAFYQRWKAEIHIYGIGLLLTLSGLLTGREKAAAIVFGIMLLYDLMRRFGEPYRALGEQEITRRQQAQQQWWREQTEDLISRFLVRTTPPASATPPPPPPPTRLIAAPGSQDEEPPESPSSPLAEIERPTAPSPIPIVTHPT